MDAQLRNLRIPKTDRVPNRVMTPMTVAHVAMNIFGAASSYGSITFCTDVRLRIIELFFDSSSNPFVLLKVLTMSIDWNLFLHSSR